MNFIIIAKLQVQSTIGQQIRLGQRIGKGRYGDVYLGEWGGTSVAVKSFHSTEENSWTRERQIYQLALLKHPNILGRKKVYLSYFFCNNAYKYYADIKLIDNKRLSPKVLKLC